MSSIAPPDTASTERRADRLRGIVELDPRVALGSSRFDPVALWVVYLMRKSVWPLLFLSAIVLSLSGRDGERFEGIDSVQAFVSAVESPFIVALTALSLKLASIGLGFLLAYPLSHTATMVAASHSGRFHSWGRWMDRLHVARAYRSLRWTKAVREAAADRIGTPAKWFQLVERLLGWSLPVLFVGSLVAHAAVT